MDCVSTTSQDHCTCTYMSCDKRGACCKCVIYHRAKGEVPGCFFSPAAERTYNRSVAELCRDRLR